MDTPPRKKGEISREKIIAAAYRLFLKQGYHATTMRQVVHEAGLTMGGLITISSRRSRPPGVRPTPH